MKELCLFSGKSKSIKLATCRISLPAINGFFKIVLKVVLTGNSNSFLFDHELRGILEAFFLLGKYSSIFSATLERRDQVSIFQPVQGFQTVFNLSKRKSHFHIGNNIQSMYFDVVSTMQLLVQAAISNVLTSRVLSFFQCYTGNSRSSSFFSVLSHFYLILSSFFIFQQKVIFSLHMYLCLISTRGHVTSLNVIF